MPGLIAAPHSGGHCCHCSQTPAALGSVVPDVPVKPTKQDVNSEMETKTKQKCSHEYFIDNRNYLIPQCNH